MIGHKETDSSPARKKRKANFPADDIHLRLKTKGFKIYSIGKPVFDIGDKEGESGGDKRQDTPG